MSQNRWFIDKISDDEVENIISDIKIQFEIPSSTNDKTSKISLCDKIKKSLLEEIKGIITQYDNENLLKILLNDLSDTYEIKHKMIMNKEKFSLRMEDIVNKTVILKSLIELISAEQKRNKEIITQKIYGRLLALMSCYITYGNYSDIIRFIDDAISISDILSMKFDQFYNNYLSNKKEYVNEKIKINNVDLKEIYHDKNSLREKAYKEEFIVGVRDLIDLFKNIISLNKQNVTAIPYKEFIENIKYISNLEISELEQIINKFTLTYKGDWFENDNRIRYDPWIHKREYSFLLKPFVLFDDTIYYENNHLKETIYSLIDKIENGLYISENKSMDKFIHNKINEKGKRLTNYVYNWYKKNTDLYIQKDIKIPFNKKENSLGDIDIFIVNNETKSIFIIECKNIQGMSSKEIYNQLNNFSKYRKKHEKRVKWVKSNIEEIEKHFQSDKLDIKNYKVNDFFLVSEHIIPIFYIENTMICTLNKLLEIEEKN